MSDTSATAEVVQAGVGQLTFDWPAATASWWQCQVAPEAAYSITFRGTGDRYAYAVTLSSQQNAAGSSWDAVLANTQMPVAGDATVSGLTPAGDGPLWLYIAAVAVDQADLAYPVAGTIDYALPALPATAELHITTRSSAGADAVALGRQVSLISLVTIAGASAEAAPRGRQVSLISAVSISSATAESDYRLPTKVQLPTVEFDATGQFQAGAVRQLPADAVTADNPIRITLRHSGHLELAPPPLSLAQTRGLRRRATPSVTVTMPTPAITDGRPVNPRYWGRTASHLAVIEGPNHVHAIPDPDPKWNPALSGWYDPSVVPSAGVGDGRWTANTLPDPASFGRSMYWLGEPSSADNTIGIAPAARQWAPDPSTPGAPSWRSIFPYKPSVWSHVHYGAGGNVLTVSRGVRLNLQFIEHMWLDFGHTVAQPFTWLIVGIVMDFPRASYVHHLLDMGRDPRLVGFPPISAGQAQSQDFTINDGGGYRNMLAVGINQMSMGSEDNISAGHVIRAPFNMAARPRMFFGVFNGANSLVGNYSRDGKYQTRGRVANGAAQEHRYYVLGRQKGRLSGDAASHLVVFEMRVWHRALSLAELGGQYDQLASTWKFGEYR